MGYGAVPHDRHTALHGALKLAYVKAVGVEVAPFNVQVNAIAQNWVSNPTSYPPEVVASSDFSKRLRDVPIGRVAEGWESAALVLFLAGPESDFFVSQVVPFPGGWIA
jgi:2-keto-3-deoxy-L-fuconate dehydrogenase